MCCCYLLEVLKNNIVKPQSSNILTKAFNVIDVIMPAAESLLYEIFCSCFVDAVVVIIVVDDVIFVVRNLE